MYNRNCTSVIALISIMKVTACNHPLFSVLFFYLTFTLRTMCVTMYVKDFITK